MTDPITIVAIISAIASAIVGVAGALHYKLRMSCCCCNSECTETEEQKETKRITKVSSIKSI